MRGAIARVFVRRRRRRRNLLFVRRAAQSTGSELPVARRQRESHQELALTRLPCFTVTVGLPQRLRLENQLVAAGTEKVAAAELGEGQGNGLAGDTDLLGELLMGDVNHHAISRGRSGGGLAQVNQCADQTVVAVFENQAGGILAKSGELGGKLLDQLDAHDGLVGKMSKEALGGNDREGGGNDGFGGFAVLIQTGEGGRAAPFI